MHTPRHPRKLARRDLKIIALFGDFVKKKKKKRKGRKEVKKKERKGKNGRKKG